ncbi:MAG: DUF3106 domain-containing protein [Terriglobia bacterium]
MAAALACVILFSAGAVPARQRVIRPPRPPRPRANQPWRQHRIQQDAHQHAPGFFQRLRDLPPVQQDQVLRNDAQFHRLPLVRQQQIRQRLAQWNTRTPRQKQTLRQREEIFQSLSPAKRRELTRVFPEYRKLGPGRQEQVMRVFRRLRNMPPGQRRRFLNSPAFGRRFTPRQQYVLRGLNDLLPQ